MFLAADLGRTVRARRKQDGLTLVEAAGLIDVGVRFLSELENGKPTVRLDKVLQVLEALGLQLQIGEASSPPAAITEVMPSAIRKILLFPGWSSSPILGMMESQNTPSSLR